MGLFDLPGPLFAWIDGGLSAFLPPAANLLMWAAVGAVGSMEIYRMLSPQSRIAGLKKDLDLAKRRVAEYDGPFEGAGPLIGGMLSLALKRVLIVFPSTILASLPLLALIVWVDTAYGWTFPPAGQAPKVEVSDPYRGEWIGPIPPEPPRTRVLDGAGNVVADIPMTSTVPVVHKKRWWNVLIGNPLGYLEEAVPVNSIAIELPSREILPVGPAWLRGWEPIFFTALITMALVYKSARRIG